MNSSVAAKERSFSVFGIPIYAFLVPIFPFVQVAAANIDRSHAAEAIWPTVIALAAYLVIMFALRLIFRKPAVSDLLWALVYTCIFYTIVFLDPVTTRLPWLVVFLGLMAAVLFWKESRKLFPIVLTIAAIVLLYSSLSTIFLNDIWTKRPIIEKIVGDVFQPLPAPTAPPTETPHVYYFVFDRYNRADYLKKVYGYDNEPFLTELRKRGFYIVDQSFANYQRTAHSVISTLNLDYLDKLERPETKGNTDWQPIFNMFQTARLGPTMQSMGYDYHFWGTWWNPTRRIEIADFNHNIYDIPEIPRLVYEYSLLVNMTRALGWQEADPLFWQCQRSKWMFENLRAAAPGSKPSFHFAHFLIPHPPFVTEESGRCMLPGEANKKTRAENYIGQVKFTNSEILKTVDALLAQPGPKPIIVLQADEGPWPKPFAGNETSLLGRDVSRVDWQSVDAETLREKMAIFSAIYAPKLAASEFGPRHTPVNTFRKILKSYFNVPLEPLPDRNKVYLNDDNLLTFMDVTEKLYGP